MTPKPGTAEIPLFPLNAVLFPGGLLPLRIFEARYMDMVTRCLREGTRFGVCLIAAGSEVGEPALPRTFGTEAAVVASDMDEPGILNIVVRGERRFRVLDHELQRDGLLTATVAWVVEPPVQPVPAAVAALVPLLAGILGELAERFPDPPQLDDAAWVGARYAELLPIPLAARQALLELDDVLGRLEIIEQFLKQHRLLPPG